MERIEYRTYDKTDWGEGAWQNEPDKIQFECMGLPALIKRNHGGALCGYVGVPEGHPWYGKHYDDVSNVDVHGGLTYSDFCVHDPDPAKGICHIPAPGEPDNVWWLGFDCAHWEDFAPRTEAQCRAFGLSGTPRSGTIYRTVEYVENEIEGLARQVLDAAALPGGD